MPTANSRSTKQGKLNVCVFSSFESRNGASLESRFRLCHSYVLLLISFQAKFFETHKNDNKKTFQNKCTHVRTRKPTDGKYRYNVMNNDQLFLNFEFFKRSINAWSQSSASWGKKFSWKEQYFTSITSQIISTYAFAHCNPFFSTYITWYLHSWEMGAHPLCMHPFHLYINWSNARGFSGLLFECIYANDNKWIAPETNASKWSHKIWNSMENLNVDPCILTIWNNKREKIRFDAQAQTLNSIKWKK